MSALLTPPLPVRTPPQARTYTLAEYQALIDTGVIREGERVELIDGHVVYAMPANPPHAAAVTRLNRRLILLSPDGYVVRCQSDAIVGTSRPEPDVCLVRGDEWAFDTRAIQLCADYAAIYAKTPEQIVRERIVAAWRFWVTVNAKIDYEQERPFGLYKPPAYERRMDELVTHPVFGYRISYRRIFEVQTRLLARHLAGEIPEFPAFCTR